jgi:hypothetical protein
LWKRNSWFFKLHFWDANMEKISGALI